MMGMQRGLRKGLMCGMPRSIPLSLQVHEALPTVALGDGKATSAALPYAQSPGQRRLPIRWGGWGAGGAGGAGVAGRARRAGRAGRVGGRGGAAVTWPSIL